MRAHSQRMPLCVVIRPFDQIISHRNLFKHDQESKFERSKLCKKKSRPAQRIFVIFLNPSTDSMLPLIKTDSFICYNQIQAYVSFGNSLISSIYPSFYISLFFLMCFLQILSSLYTSLLKNCFNQETSCSISIQFLTCFQKIIKEYVLCSQKKHLILADLMSYFGLQLMATIFLDFFKLLSFSPRSVTRHTHRIVLICDQY